MNDRDPVEDRALYLTSGAILMAAPVLAPLVTGSVLPTPLALAMAGVGGGIAVVADVAYRMKKGREEEG